MPKKITIDSLARMIQTGFESVATEFEKCATKEDLEVFATKQDFHDGIYNAKSDIVQSIEGLELKVKSYGSSWTRDFERLEERVSSLEKKRR